MRNSLIALFILVGGYALAASIATTPIVPSLRSTDRIPIGRSVGGAAYTTTQDQILAPYRNYSTAGRVTSFNGRTGAIVPSATDYSAHYPRTGSSWTFNNISANSISLRQGDAPQEIELAVSAGAGSNSITIAPFDHISSNQNIRVGTHGLYVNGTRVLSW